MKQVVFILLFIFAMQKKINLGTINDEFHKSVYEYNYSSNCAPGYEKKCYPRRGIYIRSQKPLKQCFCYKKKDLGSLEKKIANDSKTTKDKTIKDETKKDKTIKDYQITGKPVKVFENSGFCKKGEYYVCYDMMTSRFFKREFTQCHCSTTRYWDYMENDKRKRPFRIKIKKIKNNLSKIK